MQQSPNNVLDFYRQRKKERENAAYFLSKGDELSARKALSKSAEIDYELVKKIIKVCVIVTYTIMPLIYFNCLLIFRSWQLKTIIIGNMSNIVVGFANTDSIPVLHNVVC